MTAPEPPVDARFRILFEDESLAVVEKSGNIPCHPAGRYREHTLAHLLVSRAGFPAVHWVNRLDRETSGLVVVAKTPEAASRLGKSLMANRFRKRYLVAVEGVWHHPEDFSATGWIHPARSALVHKMRVFVPDAATCAAYGLPASSAPLPPPPGATLGGHVLTGAGQASETLFRPIAVGDRPPAPSPDPPVALLEAEPRTGRVHQIRATLRALGFPVVGDKLYGPDEGIYARLCDDAVTDADRARLRMRRQALHASRIAFPHPFEKREIAVESPLPQDMRALLWYNSALPNDSSEQP